MKKTNNVSNFRTYVKKREATINTCKNVLLYTRVSSKDQAENNGSLETQLIGIEKFCNEKEYEIIGM